jgi:phage I-like protein
MYFLKDLQPFEVQQNLSRVLVALEGTWHGHAMGSFSITKEIMNQMVQNFEAKSIDTVCDYEHQTLTGQTAPASGWIKQIELSEENGLTYLYAHVEWTDEAKGMIQSKEYRYISPVYAPSTIDQKSGNNIGWTLHSLSLTNTPFLEELGEVIANTKATHDVNIALSEKNKRLEDELKTAREEIDKLKANTVETDIDTAIANKKLHPSQREAAIALATQNPDGFLAFMSGSRTFIQKPQDDLFANKGSFHGKDDQSDLNKIAAGLK